MVKPNFEVRARTLLLGFAVTVLSYLVAFYVFEMTIGDADKLALFTNVVSFLAYIVGGVEWGKS